MQKITIKEEFSQGWVRMFAHLATLFFEQCKIVTEDEEGSMSVEFILDRQNKSQLTGKAILTTNGVNYTSEFTETELIGDEKIITRQHKRIYSHIFLEVLEQVTGMKQSWGILTGIRPMKLYHKYRQEGYSSQDSITQLMEDYLDDPLRPLSHAHHPYSGKKRT